MPDDPTSPTPDPTLFAEDSLASLSHRQEDSLLKTTPAISGRKCLELSGNSGPLGLLERTLLGSSNWAWTKYSLTWKAKATPQGRLIFQLARQAPRTSDNGSGLLHTPTAKANQMAPSMATRDSGSWGLGLGGAKPHHMWPTPTTSEAKSDTHNVQNRIDKDKQVMLCHAVRLYPTDPKTTGALNPQWVAWLMGYPTEYLNSVRWETASSRKSRKKSDKQ